MTTTPPELAAVLDWITSPDDVAGQAERLNEVRRQIAGVSPFAAHPVDCIEWVPSGNVHHNAYNPNAVAPPEMELLALSIAADGYTQPIVTYPQDDGTREVVDGFHRNRVGKENEEVRAAIHDHLPLVTIRAEQEDIGDRMAATIRHNRARGSHQVVKMSEIVNDLKRRNWTDGKIMKNLGMDADEVLRLSQIGGLAAEFADRDFSMAWEAEEAQTEDIDDMEGVLADADG